MSATLTESASSLPQAAAEISFVSSLTPLTLDNCAREPIHIPGLIQPHGALFAFDNAGVLVHRSANAATLLGERIPKLGEPMSPETFPDYPAFHVVTARVQAEPDDAVVHAASLRGEVGKFVLIAHRTPAGLVCEFETGEGAELLPEGFAFAAYRAIDRLKNQATVLSLLGAAVEELRQMTGFDRVMAYRFRHDDSGDIVAESVSTALEPFLGRRYPAGDIPEQARRLYVINTLRLIADARAAPVAVEAHGVPGSLPPLDMSHGVLRSVSPVHLEYMQNMGVAASMSVSIVIGGKLWGMLACHHMQPRRVHYTVRMACDVLVQVLGARVQGVLVQRAATRADAAASLRSRLVEQVLHADDVSTALSGEVTALCEGFNAHGVVLADGGKVQVFGGIDPAVGTALVEWLGQRSGGRRVEPRQLVLMNSLVDLPAGLAAQMGVWCGVMALPFGAESPSWLVLLRKEEVETVLWGGRPEKDYTIGPLGARLTPRGSFDLWREIVSGQAVPWDVSDIEGGEKLLGELLRADVAHLAEMTRARSQLMAMLGHDLRDPLQAISNTVTLMQQTGGNSALTQRLQSSSSRMQRLVSQVMDMSLMQRGFMAFDLVEVELGSVLRQLILEARSAYPAMEVLPILPPRFMVDADADRIGQVLSNLLGNAGHHGAPGEPVLVQLVRRGDDAVLEVSNVGPPIDEALVDSLFEPFKRRSAPSPTNRNGLGLGLYIAQQIMAGHGGSLSYSHADPYVVFTARFPMRCAAPSGIAPA